MKNLTDIKKILETFIIIAIMLVVVQTLLDEFSRYAHWSVRHRNMLLVAGFCFDLIFSAEFTVRSICAGKKGKFLSYIRYQRGWVDFICSFPLLILDSGPSLFFLLTADFHSGSGVIGAMNLLKMVKAVRITRILRLVRVVKIFGKIHNAESEMAQHHISAVATTAVFTVVSVLIVFTLFFRTTAAGLSKERAAEYINLVNGIKSIADMNNLGFRESAEPILMQDRNILKIIYTGGTEVCKTGASEFTAYYDQEDYISVTGKSCMLIVSIADINSGIALENIQNFLIIIFIVIAFMFIYTKHFVQNISDVVHVMNLGFRKRDYNLLVKIPEQNADHEIYRLAKFYNDAYLPSKMKKADRDFARNRSLSMKDLTDFR